MNASPPQSRPNAKFRPWRIASLMGVTIGLGGAAACWVSYAVDQAALRQIADLVSDGGGAPTDRAIALTEWVHRAGSKRRNDQWFGLPGWRATPMQIALTSGDCADKSRLLVALLRSLDMPATVALCMDGDGRPAHVIVEAETTPGQFMVFDPAFNLWFPKPGGGYYDLLDLRTDPEIVARRVSQLPSMGPAGQDRNEYYQRSGADYRTATTIHWNRGPLTRVLHSVCTLWMGDQCYRLRRPVGPEEPKLRACGSLLFLASLIGFLNCLPLFVIRWKHRRADRGLTAPLPMVESVPV